MAPTTFLYLNLIIMSLASLPNEKERADTYLVKKISRDIQLTGKGDDPQWQRADSLSDFSFPWETEQPQPTVFRALHNDDWFYCLFDVTDANINILQVRDDKWEVASSSRAEIFLRIDDELNPYYCLELDPLGRVLDYQGVYHRKFDRPWSWPEGQLVVKAEKRTTGYTVEVALSKSSLTALGLLKNNQLEAGIFRADCFIKPDGTPDFKWASWIIPDSPTPDFHIPSSFGLLHLED